MSIRMLLASCVVFALTAVAGDPAFAEPPTFRISQIYSNFDGSIQFVELTEFAGLDGQHRFAGLTLTTTHDGVVKQYTFPQDLPTEMTAHLSIVVAALESYYMPVTDESQLTDTCCYQPTFRSLPVRFLPTTGATLDFAGADQVTYTALPVDGEKALYRDGTVRGAILPANGTCYFGYHYCPSLVWIDYLYMDVFAREYYNASLDHYFVTAYSDEIDAIDAGRISGWQPTGERFRLGQGLDAYKGHELPVCRFYMPPDAGDSHFFSASSDECIDVQSRFPGFVLESTTAFFATLPDLVAGTCPIDYRPDLPRARLKPVYRLWNGRLDSNHRYTSSETIRDDMVNRGYVSEGYGPMGVAMCVR